MGICLSTGGAVHADGEHTAVHVSAQGAGSRSPREARDARARPSAPLDAVTPALLLQRQRAAGNAAVVSFLERRGLRTAASRGARGTGDGRPPGASDDRPAREPAARVPAVQRLIVNVGDRDLPALDAYVYVAVDHAYRRDATQNITDFDVADFRGPQGLRNDHEPVYLVGHGEPGKLGTRSAAAVVRKLTHPRRGLPSHYAGTVTSLSCFAGVPARGGDPLASGVHTLAAGLGESGRPGVEVEGPRGLFMVHSVAGTRTVKPAYQNPWEQVEKEKEEALPFKSRFETWQERNPSATPPQRAAMATAMSHGFYKSLIQEVDETGWGLDEGQARLRAVSGSLGGPPLRRGGQPPPPGPPPAG